MNLIEAWLYNCLKEIPSLFYPELTYLFRWKSNMYDLYTVATTYLYNSYVYHSVYWFWSDVCHSNLSERRKYIIYHILSGYLIAEFSRQCCIV